MLIWAVMMWAYESAAQFVSITSKNGLMGMLCYMQLWFTSMLFCVRLVFKPGIMLLLLTWALQGILIDNNDVPWPFRIFTW